MAFSPATQGYAEQLQLARSYLADPIKRLRKRASISEEEPDTGVIECTEGPEMLRKKARPTKCKWLLSEEA